MSNYTTFFPAASGGGSTEITDPDKINKITLATGTESYISAMFYSLDYLGSAYDSNSTYNGMTGSMYVYQYTGGGRVAQTVNNTEITLANVTSGSGYLCNILTPVGAKGTTQEIKITIDGGTEKVYTFDYSSDSQYNNKWTRLLWGSAPWGSNEEYNNHGDDNNAGFAGLGGMVTTNNYFSLPPMLFSDGSYGTVRIVSPAEFKNYNLPKLRFTTSLVVKCKTTTLYSTSNAQFNCGRATYYLDSQL